MTNQIRERLLARREVKETITLTKLVETVLMRLAFDCET